MAGMTMTMEMSPDVSITKTEVFDADMASWILKNVPLGKDDKMAQTRYYRKGANGNHVVVTYKLGKDVRHEFLGRFCAVKGVGLQALPRQVRNALAAKYYWDLDMENAQPTLLAQYCDKNGIVCSAVKKYVEQREALLTEVADALQTDRDDAKQRIVALFYGASADGMPAFFQDELMPELRRIMKIVYDMNHASLKFLNGKDNRAGKALAYILQTEERACMMALDRAVGRNGRILDVIIHDGGLVRKLPNEMSFPEELLHKLEERITHETGYKVHLKVKPLTYSIEKPEEHDEYSVMKREFEETHFKLMNPLAYVRIHNKTIQVLTTAELREMYLWKEVGDSSFIDMWRYDETIRCYECLGFYPKCEAPAGVFNIFNGFPLEARKGDVSAVHEVLNLVAGENEQMADYIEKWCAWIVQKPYLKTGTCLVVEGEEGVGKDTFFDFVGELLGSEYFFNTSRPEADVFDKFNGHIKRTLLMKFEEAKYATNKANSDDLKSLITCDKMAFQDKGMKSMMLNCYFNLVMTTNHEVPVVLSDTNRRFCLIQASSAKRGNFEFWNRIHAELKKTETKQAYLHHLLSIDLTDFNPRSFPISSYHEEVKQSFIPYHASYFQEMVEEGAGAESVTMMAKSILEQVNRKTTFQIHAQKFGREMKLYPESVITKTHTERGASYRIRLEPMREFLKMKKWWFEL